MISKANLKKTIRLAKEYNDKACQPTRFSLSDLEGLMDYGRNLDPQYPDIFAKKHFEEQREVFVQEHPSSDGKEEAIKYLIAKGPLADYLESAAKALELI